MSSYPPHQMMYTDPSVIRALQQDASYIQPEQYPAYYNAGYYNAGYMPVSDDDDCCGNYAFTSSSPSPSEQYTYSPNILNSDECRMSHTGGQPWTITG
jgi:hypothetical protein